MISVKSIFSSLKSPPLDIFRHYEILSIIVFWVFLKALHFWALTWAVPELFFKIEFIQMFMYGGIGL